MSWRPAGQRRVAEVLGEGAIAYGLAMQPGAKLKLDPSTSLTDLPLQFADDPNTGIGWASANVMRLVANGATSASVAGSGSFQPVSIYTAGQVTIDAGADLVMSAGGQILADPGTQALPGYAFSGDPDSGIFRQGANTLGLVAGGVNTYAWDGTNYFQVPNYFNGDARFSDVMVVPPAIANYGSFYATDVAGKVRLVLKLGAAGTLVTLGTEA